MQKKSGWQQGGRCPCVKFCFPFQSFVYIAVVQQFLGHQVSRFMGPDVVLLAFLLLYSKIQCFPNICLPFSLLSFKSSQAINKNAVSQFSEVSNSFPVDKICMERQIKIQTKSLLLLNSILILELHFFDLFLSSSFNSSTFHPQCLQLTKKMFIIINHCSQMVRWR